MNTNHPLIISTTQVTPIKTLFEALSQQLRDVSMTFNENGMTILTVDAHRTIVINVKLNASEFEYYHCAAPVTISLSISVLFQLLKTVNSGEILTFYLDPSPNDKYTYLGIKRENAQKKVTSYNKLGLYDADANNIEIDPVEYSCNVIMPSISFQKIIRDMKNLSTHVEIQNVGNKIIFKCAGFECSQETIMTDSRENREEEASHNEVAIYNKNSDEIIQGVYLIRCLSSFTKCTQLSNVVELNMANKMPITVQYNVANMGYIRMCLLPLDSEEDSD
jgi:proliferating cell nuclear antigen PCNA